MNNYLFYLISWIVLASVLWILMRIIPAKMKKVEDKQTKSNLFFILLLFGIPIFFVITILPLLFLFGDENLPANYKYIFIGVVVLYLIVVAALRKKTSETS